MIWLADMSALSRPVLALALGEVALYVASRAAADAVAGGGDRRPGRLALGHWVAVAAAAWVAAAGGSIAIAVGVIFGTSVAALSLAMGLVTYVNPPGELPPSRRAWPFVLPAALLPMIAGFSGHLGPGHALAMIALGAAVFAVWWGAARQEPSLADVFERAAESPGSSAHAWTGLRAAQWVLAIAFAALGAKLAVGGAAEAGAASRLLPGNLVSAAVLSPLLVLPMLATGTDLAQRGRAGDACGALVGVALLNLCVLLPAVILLWYVRSAAAAAASGAPIAGTGVPLVVRGALRLWRDGQPISLPLSVWRIDSVALVVLGFAAVPFAYGRWALGRLESAALIVGYAAYVAATATIASRT